MTTNQLLTLDGTPRLSRRSSASARARLTRHFAISRSMRKKSARNTNAFSPELPREIPRSSSLSSTLATPGSWNTCESEHEPAGEGIAMKAILADNDVEGILAALVSIWLSDTWRDLWIGLGSSPSRLRCRFSRGGQRRQVPLGVSMTMMGYFRRCHGRSSFAHGGSLVLDLLVERSAIGLRRVPPSVLIVPRPFPAKAVPKARCTSITTPTIA